MKKKLILLTTLLAGFVGSGVFTSCKDNDEDLRNEVLALVSGKYNRDSLRVDIEALRAELLGMVPKVEIRDGYWWIDGQNTGVKATGENGKDGQDGINGTNGVDGVTPTITISEDGYWVINGDKTSVRAAGDKVTIIEIDGVKYWAINGESTGVRAEGINGTNGTADVWTIGNDGYWYKNGEKTEYKAVGSNGADGQTPTFTISEDGYWVINGVKTEWKACGENGKDGQTPTLSIGEDGYWYINGVKTEWKACGENGQDGQTPTITISEDGYWVINGEKTEWKAIGTNGQDGQTPTITISEDGYWVINGEKTDVLAIGLPGQPGEPGQDGQTPTITIGEDGYWYINGVKTEYKAQGEPGADADKWTIGEDGYWYINGTKTEFKAIGTNGTDGSDGADGATWTIGNDGYWYLNGEKTEWKAVGTNGSDGNDGATWTIGDDGYWYKNGEKTEWKAVGADGADGQPGQNGATWTIGDDGYWYKNGEKTEWKAVGTNGADGQPGQDGATWTIGEDGYWYYNNVKTDYRAVGTNGADGQSPVIEIKNGYWYINGSNTGVKAEGKDGVDGASSVEIKDGNWWINGEDTGIPATGAPGTPGQNGADGTKIEISEDGYWVIDGTKTEWKVSEGCNCDVERYNAACDAIEAAEKALADENTSWSDVAYAGANIRKVMQELQDIREIAERAEAKADSALNALRAQISGIVIQGAYNPAFGQLSMPTGVNTNVLMAYYGNAAEAVTFPLDAFDNAGETGYDYSLVSNMPKKKFSGDIVSNAEDNAGKLYLTINPSSTDFTGIQPVLVNSLGEESLVTLSTVKPSTEKLTFGYTRAAQTGFYEATAHISAANASKVAPRIDLNKEELKAEIKDILSVRDGINWTAIGKTVYNAAHDVLDAEGVKVEWEDALGEHAVTSNYGIAATAVKALSFDFELDLTHNAINNLFEGIMGFIQRTWDEVADKFTSRYGTTLIDFRIASYALSEDGQHVIVTDSNGNTVSVPVSNFGSAENIEEYIDLANHYLSMINNIYAALIVNDSITTQIQHVLDKIQNRMQGWADGFNNKLQPVLFTSSADGTLLCSGSKVQPTELSSTSTTLVATTHTADMLAPAYLKYVACTAVYNADGTKPSNEKSLADAVNKSGDMNTIFDGNKRPVAVSGLKKGYTYELSYAAVDYQGKTRCHHYYVRVK